MDDSNVESRSRIVGRDRYYRQEEKGPERGDEREKETTGRKREEEKAVPTLRAFSRAPPVVILLKLRVPLALVLPRLQKIFITNRSIVPNLCFPCRSFRHCIGYLYIIIYGYCH